MPQAIECATSTRPDKERGETVVFQSHRTRAARAQHSREGPCACWLVRLPLILFQGPGASSWNSTGFAFLPRAGHCGCPGCQRPCKRPEEIVRAVRSHSGSSPVPHDGGASSARARVEPAGRRSTAQRAWLGLPTCRDAIVIVAFRVLIGSSCCHGRLTGRLGRAASATCAAQTPRARVRPGVAPPQFTRSWRSSRVASFSAKSAGTPAPSGGRARRRRRSRAAKALNARQTLLARTTPSSLLRRRGSPEDVTLPPCSGRASGLPRSSSTGPAPQARCL